MAFTLVMYTKHRNKQTHQGKQLVFMMEHCTQNSNPGGVFTDLQNSVKTMTGFSVSQVIRRLFFADCICLLWLRANIVNEAIVSHIHALVFSVSFPTPLFNSLGIVPPSHIVQALQIPHIFYPVSLSCLPPQQSLSGWPAQSGI